jgi:signal peptidase I
MKKRGYLLIPLTVMVLLIVLFKTVLLIGFVPSESMEPTLNKGSIILGSRIFKDLDVGDIVIFKRNGQLLVKRIAATEGQQVERNGELITVPKDSFYMLGDNESCSYDSRYWEEPFIKYYEVKAKLFY